MGVQEESKAKSTTDSSNRMGWFGLIFGLSSWVVLIVIYLVAKHIFGTSGFKAILIGGAPWFLLQIAKEYCEEKS